MSSHNDVVVGQEIVVRACGHTAILTHYSNDPFRAEHRAKIQRKRCEPCGRIASDEHNQRQATQPKKTTAGKLKKGQEVKALPVNTTILLFHQTDEAWHGSLRLPGVPHDFEADATSLIGLIPRLARKALRDGREIAGGLKLTTTARLPFDRV